MTRPLSYEPDPAPRFAIRAAEPADADGIARVLVRSWRASYRGILPLDGVLDRLDVGERASKWRRILRDDTCLHLVAYDTTHRDVIGFCEAGPRRRPGPWAGEVYAIYLEHYAKRHGLGRRFFGEVTAWLYARHMRSMIVWVLEDNHHARRFYEALGGRAAHQARSIVSGHPVIERAYVWDRL
ncbi:MAG: GNAT family N-acetyltransferase [Kofleriaceae bacterium]|nr:GNAT family N-acetyltransferase [Myxococcales bacterium]MCB9564149.1 GNAT family N-acetyltransferase [Kofleriaceae bacterium]MCB9572483.1 GNAT family N-acetyltransferase [Kofleriaceae bacterium]